MDGTTNDTAREALPDIAFPYRLRFYGHETGALLHEETVDADERPTLLTLRCMWYCPESWQQRRPYERYLTIRGADEWGLGDSAYHTTPVGGVAIVAGSGFAFDDERVREHGGLRAEWERL